MRCLGFWVAFGLVAADSSQGNICADDVKCSERLQGWLDMLDDPAKDNHHQRRRRLNEADFQTAGHLPYSLYDEIENARKSVNSVPIAEYPYPFPGYAAQSASDAIPSYPPVSPPIHPNEFYFQAANPYFHSGPVFQDMMYGRYYQSAGFDPYPPRNVPVEYGYNPSVVNGPGYVFQNAPSMPQSLPHPHKGHRTYMNVDPDATRSYRRSDFHGMAAPSELYKQTQAVPTRWEYPADAVANHIVPKQGAYRPDRRRLYSDFVEGQSLFGNSGAGSAIGSLIGGNSGIGSLIGGGGAPGIGSLIGGGHSNPVGNILDGVLGGGHEHGHGHNQYGHNHQNEGYYGRDHGRDQHGGSYNRERNDYGRNNYSPNYY